MQLLATATATANRNQIARLFAALAAQRSVQLEQPLLPLLSQVFEALLRRKLSIPTILADLKAKDAGAAEKLNRIIENSSDLALDKSANEATREAAIRLQAAVGGSDLSFLGELLQPATPARLQSAALDALARSGNPKTSSLLLAGWKGHSPTLRAKALDALLSRPAWTGELLAALLAKTVLPNEIPTVTQQRLLNHADAKLRSKAATLFTGSSSESRAAVIARYKGVESLKGDVVRGSQLFMQQCAQCHNFRGQGFAVGATLNNLEKDAGWFLLNILDPNAAIDPRYIAYNVETKDGRSLTGVMAAESSSSVTLVAGGGVRETVLRSDIASIRSSNLSLMPEGLEQALPPQEMADLIAFLRAPTAAPAAAR